MFGNALVFRSLDIELAVVKYLVCKHCKHDYHALSVNCDIGTVTNKIMEDSSLIKKKCVSDIP